MKIEFVNWIFDFPEKDNKVAKKKRKVKKSKELSTKRKLTEVALMIAGVTIVAIILFHLCPPF